MERPHFVILWGAVWGYALRWLMLSAPMGWGGAFVLCCMCLFLLTFYVVVLFLCLAGLFVMGKQCSCCVP